MGLRTAIRFVALDMGGVLLRNTSGRPFVRNRLDFRGREALVQSLARGGARVSLDELSEILIDPWVAEYERRDDRLEEARWEPHLERLRERVGSRADDRELLEVWFRPYGEQLVAIDGAREALDALRGAGYRLALVSNVPFPGELYRALLARVGLLEPFDDVLFSYDFGSRKPSPAMLRRAMESAGAEPRETVMVGDRPTLDIAAGLSAGTRTVWVESDFRKGPRAEASIRSVAELPGLLASWAGPGDAAGAGPPPGG